MFPVGTKDDDNLVGPTSIIDFCGVASTLCLVSKALSMEAKTQLPGCQGSP